MKPNISALLRQMQDYRKKRGLSQDRVAEAMSLGKSTLSEMERGKSGVALDRWIQWCATLRLTPSEILRKWEQDENHFAEIALEHREAYHKTIDWLIKFGFTRELETVMGVLQGIVDKERQLRKQQRSRRKLNRLLRARR